MAIKFSVVIICKNAALTIEKAIGSSFLCSKDVVVVDTGSTDATLAIIRSTAAKLHHQEWLGYGASKNQGNTLAENDWIFSLDADECIDSNLAQQLLQLDELEETTTVAVDRLNYLGKKAIRYGEWAGDRAVRIFNRKNTEWDTSTVHEHIIQKQKGEEIRLSGVIHHFTALNIQQQKLKLEKYAELMAEKYFQTGRKANWLIVYLSPLVNFLLNYIFRVGFLDGKEGYQLAKANAWYTFRKYQLLKQKYTETKTGS